MPRQRKPLEPNCPNCEVEPLQYRDNPITGEEELVCEWCGYKELL